MPDRTAAVADHVSATALRLLAGGDVPGLAVGVCDRSGVLWSAGFGTTGRAGGAPVTPQTLFCLMSGTKPYTAATVMLAVQEGLLDLDEPVATHLPELRLRSAWEDHPERRITLRLLLSHRAGLTHEAPRGSNFDAHDVSFDDHCRSIAGTWLRFPVGHHAEYSNLGPDLAAWAVERVTGSRFVDRVREGLLRPLGLDRTTADPDRVAQDPDRAVGHSRHGTPGLRVPMLGGAGVWAGVDDALRHLAFHLDAGAGLLDPALLDQMYAIPDPFPGQRLGFGLGVATSDWGGRTVRGHSGSGFGFACDLGWDPAAGVGVAVLVNSDDHPLGAALATEVLQLLSPVAAARGAGRSDLPRPAPTTPTPAQRPPQDWAGEYVRSDGLVTHLTVTGDEATLERGGVVERARAAGPGRLVTDGRPGERGEMFLLVDAYGAPGPDHLVHAVDGTVSYRNPAGGPGVEPEEDAASEERFAVDYLGSLASTLVLRRGRTVATLQGSGYDTFPPLTLTPLGPELWSTPLGEVLDVAASPPSYANIALRRLDRAASLG